MPCLTQACMRDRAGCQARPLSHLPLEPVFAFLGLMGEVGSPRAQAGAEGMVHWGWGAEAQLDEISPDYTGRSLPLPPFSGGAQAG